MTAARFVLELVRTVRGAIGWARMFTLGVVLVLGYALGAASSPSTARADLASSAERIARALERANVLTERGCK